MSLKTFQYCELLSLGVALLLIPRLRNTHYIVFVPYLLIVVFVDVVSNYLNLYINKTNQWLSNLYLPVMHLFFSWLFIKAFLPVNYKRFVMAGIIAFGVTYVVDISFIHGFWEFNTVTFLYSAFVFIISSGLFLLQMLRQDDKIIFYSEPMFWLSIATLIFFIGFSIFFAVFFYYKDSPADYNNHLSVYKFLRKYIITSHYLLLIVSLLTIRKRQHV